MRKTHTIKTNEHPFVDKLVDAIGGTAAGHLLGMSNSYFVPSSLAEGIRPCVEMAAELVWKRDFEPAQPQATTLIAIVTVPAEKFETVELLVTALGGDSHTLVL